MSSGTTGKTSFLTRTATLLFVFFVLTLCLVLSTAAPAVQAAQADVDEAVAMLAALRGSDVDAEWPPDVEANTARVETMLAAVQRCTPAERAAMDAPTQEGMLAYFRTLYGVQGRNTAELDSLFSGTGAPAVDSSSQPASSQPMQSSSTPEDDSSQAASSKPDSSPAASSSGSSSRPVPSASGALPGTTHPPQTTGGGGFAAFFGNNILASLLIIVLALLIVLVFFRFLAAQRAANRQAAATAERATREDAPETPAVAVPFVLNQPAHEETPREARRRKRQERKNARRTPEDTAFDEPVPDDAHLWATTPEESSIWDTPLTVDTAPQTTPAEEAILEESFASEEPGGAALKPITPPTTEENPGRKHKAKRTGRPGRMPFRVGDVGDIDGIDD